MALWLAAALALASGTHPILRPGAPPAAGVRGLFAGVLAGHDTVTHDYPAYWWGWSQVRQTGQLPLWNPSWFCGEPFIASQTFMPFYPPNWLGALLPFPFAFNLQYPLHLVLAALVMAWACRRRGLGWWAAGLAGLSWGLGGHLATLAGPGHIQKLQTLAWLPMVTLGAACLGRGHVRRAMAPLGAGLALQVTAGHLQIVYLTLVVAAFDALWGAWARARTSRTCQTGWTRPIRRTLRAVGRPLLGGLGAGTLALGLSAAFWVPTVEFARLSNREGALDWENATRGSLPPAEAFEFALPRLLGDSMPHGRGLYLGRYGESSTSDPERIVSNYVGAGVLLFALYALLAGGQRRMAAWRYGVLAAGALTLSLGRYLTIGDVELYRYALKLVPGLAHFRAPSVAMALTAYGLVMAAAIGVDRFFRSIKADVSDLSDQSDLSDASDSRARAERTFRVRGSVMLLLAVAALVPALMARNTLAVYAHHGDAWPTDDARRQAQAHVLRTRAIQQTGDDLLVVLALAGVWAWVAFLPEGLRGRRWAGNALLGALVAAWTWGLVRNARPFWNAEPLAPYEQFLTSHWALGIWERAQGPVRIFEPDNELSNRALTLSDFRRGRSIGSLHGYHPVAYERYFDLVRRLGFLNPSLLRLLAVDYLLWDDTRGETPPIGFGELRAVAGQRLLVNPENTYAHAMRAPQRVDTWDEALERLAEPGWSVARATLVTGEPSAGEPPFADGALAGLRVESVESLAPGETLLRVTSERPAWLVVREPAAPGWRARVNDRDAPLATVDGFFIGIPVAAGRNAIILNYDPPSQRFGFFISFLTLGWAAWIFGKTAKSNSQP